MLCIKEEGLLDEANEVHNCRHHQHHKLVSPHLTMGRVKDCIHGTKVKHLTPGSITFSTPSCDGCGIQCGWMHGFYPAITVQVGFPDLLHCLLLANFLSHTEHHLQNICVLHFQNILYSSRLKS